MKAKTVKRIVILLLLIISTCSVVPMIARHRSKQRIFERIGEARDTRESYLAVVELIFSNQINIDEKNIKLQEMLTGNDMLSEYAALRALYGLSSSRSRVLADFSELKDAVLDNMLILSQRYEASGNKNTDIKSMLFYSVAVLRGLDISTERLDDLRIADDLPDFLRQKIESEIIQIRYPDEHMLYQQAVKDVNSVPMEVNEWKRVVELIQLHSPSNNKNLYVREHIQYWQESVFQDAINAYGNMANETKNVAWKYLKEALASEDEDVRYRGLMGCYILAHHHFGEIRPIMDEMYRLLSEHEHNCDDYPINQRHILILTKYFLAKGLHEDGQIAKEEFDRVSEKCKQWLYGTSGLPSGSD